jgi:hypothetical protein
MRPFSELQPGDLFFWQSGTWRKIHPCQNVEGPHKPHHNAVKVTQPTPTAGAALAPRYGTFAGWLVMVEPSDVEELAQAVTP